MSHASPSIDLTDRNIELGSKGGTARIACLFVGVICLAAAFILVFTGQMEWTAFWKAWLQNWFFILEISLGALFFVFIQHLTKAGWSTAIRRPAEVLASNLNWLWVGFIPFLILLLMGKAGHIFPWSDMEMLAAEAPAEAHLVEGKLAYLNTPFFLIRALIYFVVWAFFGTWFLRASLKQGRTDDSGPTRVMQKMACPAAILFGLTITFAAFDWIMSLSPGWFSTMFGVYAFTGAATCGFAVLIITCILLQRNGAMVNVITREHYQDMGKLMFGFGMVFWAYIGFSQYMLIWYANIPVVVAMERFAIGAGAGLALVADYIVAGENARMSFPFLQRSCHQVSIGRKGCKLRCLSYLALKYHVQLTISLRSHRQKPHDHAPKPCCCPFSKVLSFSQPTCQYRS